MRSHAATRLSFVGKLSDLGLLPRERETSHRHHHQPPHPFQLPLSRVETEEPKAVVPSTAQSGSSASQDPVNKPLWEAWSVEADEAAGGVEYLGG